MPNNISLIELQTSCCFSASKYRLQLGRGAVGPTWVLFFTEAVHQASLAMGSGSRQMLKGEQQLLEWGRRFLLQALPIIYKIMQVLCRSFLPGSQGMWNIWMSILLLKGFRIRLMTISQPASSRFSLRSPQHVSVSWKTQCNTILTLHSPVVILKRTQTWTWTGH